MTDKEDFAFILVKDPSVEQWWCLCPAYPGLSVFAVTPEAALAEAQRVLPDFVALDPQRGHCMTAPQLMRQMFGFMNCYLRLGLTDPPTPEDVAWAQGQLEGK